MTVVPSYGEYVETYKDLAAWYQTDQKTAQAVYTAADTATLAAVLPMLDREIETAKQALANWQRSLADGQDATAALEEQRNEVLVALQTRAEADPAWQELAVEVGASLASALDDVQARSHASGQDLVDVAFIQAIALAERRHLVRTELQRRGLLPVFGD